MLGREGAAAIHAPQRPAPTATRGFGKSRTDHLFNGNAVHRVFTRPTARDVILPRGWAWSSIGRQNCHCSQLSIPLHLQRTSSPSSSIIFNIRLLLPNFSFDCNTFGKCKPCNFSILGISSFSPVYLAVPVCTAQCLVSCWERGHAQTWKLVRSYAESGSRSTQ